MLTLVFSKWQDCYLQSIIVEISLQSQTCLQLSVWLLPDFAGKPCDDRGCHTRNRGAHSSHWEVGLPASVQQQNYGEELQDLLTCSCLSFMKQVLSPYNLTCYMLWFSPGAVLVQAVHSSSLICKHLRSWNSAKSSETSQEFHSYAHKACWNPRNLNRAGITFPLQVLYTGKVWPHWLFALINLQHSIFDCHLMFVFAYRLQTQGVF